MIKKKIATNKLQGPRFVIILEPCSNNAKDWEFKFDLPLGEFRMPNCDIQFMINELHACRYNKPQPCFVLYFQESIVSLCLCRTRVLLSQFHIYVMYFIHASYLRTLNFSHHSCKNQECLYIHSVSSYSILVLIIFHQEVTNFKP